MRLASCMTGAIGSGMALSGVVVKLLCVCMTGVSGSGMALCGCDCGVVVKLPYSVVCAVCAA